MLIVLWADEAQDGFLQRYGPSLTILFLVAMVLGALLILVPQLLRSRQQSQEMIHAENMRALERGEPMTRTDERSLAAGRAAVLVPMVVMCAAATVTCFLVAYRADNSFSVGLAVWSVAGVVSLAAITGGVALLGRLAYLHTGEEQQEEASEEEGKESAPPPPA